MKSTTKIIGDTITAQGYNDLRSDAAGGAMLLVHAQATPGMTLKVEPGVCYVGSTRVIYAGGNTPSFTAPTTNPRIDLVTIDSAGTIAITQGTEAASPSAPAYPATKLVLAEVYNRVGETSIKDASDGTNGYVYNDVRPFLGGAFVAAASQIADGIITDIKLASAFVHMTTDETINGIKTFGSIPVLPASNPTAANEATRKAYVDTAAGAVLKDGVNQQVTTTALNTWFAVRTNTNIPAMSANSWYNLKVDLKNNDGVSAATWRISIAGTIVYTSAALSGSGSLEIDIFTLNSTGSQIIEIRDRRETSVSFAFSRVAGSINLSAAWTLLLEVNTGGGINGTYLSRFAYAKLAQ